MAAPLSEIISIVRDLMHDGDLDLSSATRFDDLENWDSMDLVTVVVRAECRYDLQLDLPAIDRVSTIGDLVHLIEAKQALTSA